MKYEAIMMDIDGTLIKNGSPGLPSERVQTAILEAQKMSHVGLATARQYGKVVPLIRGLNLIGPSILSGGAQLVNAPNEEYYYEQIINPDKVLSICTTLSTMDVNFWIQDEGTDYEFSTLYKPKKPFVIVVFGITDIQLHQIRDLISDDAIAFHTVTSSVEGMYDIHLTDPLATKGHGIEVTANILHINREHIIGVGDSNNDIPLLRSCGLKVAMGNATNDLKVIADYIAPSVDDDGITDVVERFMLNR